MGDSRPEDRAMIETPCGEQYGSSHAGPPRTNRPARCRSDPSWQDSAEPPTELAGVIGNAQLGRLLRAGPPADTRGASPEAVTLMRAASLAVSRGGRELSRCPNGGKSGCTCAACAEEGLKEELDRRR